MDLSQYKLTKRGVYLYVFRPHHKPKVYKGNIYTLKTSLNKLINPTFREKGKHKKRFTSACSMEPETVARSVVWMKERDDEKAKELYLTYLINLVADHKKRMANLIKYGNYVRDAAIDSYIFEED